MKKLIFLLQMLLVLMLVPQQAMADNGRVETLKNRLNYSVMPKGEGVFTIKVPVYVGSALGNYWAADGGGNYSKITVRINGDNGPEYTLLTYKADNYNNSAGTSNYVKVIPGEGEQNKPLGVFSFSQPSNTPIVISSSNDWVYVDQKMAKDITDTYNTTYLEFDWKADYSLFNEKDIQFSFYPIYEWKPVFTAHERFSVDFKNFITYKYTSSLTPPTIVRAYVDPDATRGYEGQVKVIGFSTKKPDMLKLYVNEKPCFTNEYVDGSDFEFVLPACDTLRVIEVEASYKGDDNYYTSIKSKPYTITPYHQIKDLKLQELHTKSPEMSSGYKKLTWSIDSKNISDMFTNDQFIVERAYSCDSTGLIGAVQVGVVAYSDTVATGKYEFLDDSEGATYNPENGGTSYTYYRVKRATATGLYLSENNKFSKVDSVKNTVVWQPWVTNIRITEDPEFDFNHKVKLRIEFLVEKGYTAQDTIGNFSYLMAKWYDETKLKLIAQTSKKSDKTVLREDTIEVNTKDLQCEERPDSRMYYILTDYTLEEPGVIYKFKAWAEKPSSAPYIKFWDNYDHDSGTIYIGDATYDNISPVRNLTLTQGTEQGFVRVNWELPGNRFNEMILLRREKGTEKFDSIAIDPISTYYTDNSVSLGVKYEYKVLGRVKYNGGGQGESICRSLDGETPYGWVAENAKIAGKVVTTQGTGIGGQQVKIYQGDKLVGEATTKNDGTFLVDTIKLNKELTDYTVQVSSEHLEFEHNGTKGGAGITIGASNPVSDDIKFVCTSVERFSGRVLFENSTVPVSGAMFRINGETVYGANNLPIKTDNNGNFEFYVPKHQVQVQVYKPGHHFADNGFVICKEDATKGIEKPFTPESAYDGLILYDKTKVLLRGRVIGGNTLAALPLGQGLTHNNLGDSITLQIKLEGNNTASLVYLLDKPDKDTLVVYNEQQWNGKTVTRTRADFFRKQIDILVDNETGEYAVELFPTKYKVTQAFAQGYASLFANGEVAQVLDLTDSVNVDSEEMKTATHSITYHSDVKITYEQLAWGLSPQPYLGVEKQKKKNLFNEDMTTTFAYVDENDNVNYLLGAPVFFSGERYFLRGTAHEDYYYNNNVETGAHFVEPIRNGKVNIQNGLTGNDPQNEEHELDQNGQFTIDFVANNNNFALSGTDALCKLHSSAVVNGFYYQSKPVEAYVTGSREKAGNVFTAKNVDINLFDILRDPYGPTGFSYYGKGKQYEMSRNFAVKVDYKAELDITNGGSYNQIVGTTAGGVLVATSTSGSTGWHTNFTIPIFSGGVTRSATYNFTSKDVIKTSDDPKDVGAMADVYIGATTDLICKTNEAITIIDEKTYLAKKKSIEAGLIKVIQEGVDIDGSKRYLVTAEELQPGVSYPSTFVYSQKHILTKVIPQLLSERNSLLVGGNPSITKEDVEEAAKKAGKTLYYYKGDQSEAAVGKYGVDYEACYPDETSKALNTDEIASYNAQIMKWVNFIRLNEELKMKAANTPSAETEHYSLSGGQNISYSEEIGYKDTGLTTKISLLGLTVFNNGAKQGSYGPKAADLLTKALNAQAKDHTVVSKEKDDEKLVNKFTQDLKNVFKNDDSNQQTNAGDAVTTLQTPVSKFEITFKPNYNIDYTDDVDLNLMTTCESGYEMKLNDDSYMNVSVYKTPADSLPNFKEVKAALGFVTGDDNSTNFLHQYVFVVNGGATRNPWIDADSTLVYSPGTPLGVRTQKIDNPVMNINTPEISNIPEDEKATFVLKLTNDSELTGNQITNHDSWFILSLVDESNEKGAKISIDGMPLTDGRTFSIAPGESINKTIEVLRGDGYDFDDIQLEFACVDDPSNTSFATFSVHYLPSSSPVRISSPSDKWVINTFSAKDSIGYYMPIVVEGYNVGYKNFDHIEIQYKKSTEGEANWVNLCSYYVDDDLYAAASGTKSMKQIGTGKITHAFYGEKDPIEMKYDIRAVTFCRLGTGFVTKSSNVITGMKDTRRPTIFGQAQPLNGILTSENNIILPFSEQIAYNYLDETSNFDIRGYLNTDDFDDNVGLVFGGKAKQDAHTTVSRNLANRDFTIDMHVKADVDNEQMTFFSHGSDDDILTFGITANRELFININGDILKSKRLDEPITDITHVGVEFKKHADDEKKQNDGKGDIRFFVGNNFIDNANGGVYSHKPYEGNSPIHFGVDHNNRKTPYPFKGRMLEVRLWNTALDVDMISEYKNKMLDGYGHRLIGYWPMRQSYGSAMEYINGAHLELSNVNWKTNSGKSLLVNRKIFELDGTSFQRNANLDYTLSFWLNIQKADANATIFSAGYEDRTANSQERSDASNGKLRIGYKDGRLVVCSNGNTIPFSDFMEDEDMPMTGGWHHFALSVSHSKNIANIYCDGYLLNQVQADKFGGISNAHVLLGDTLMTANIDKLCFWHQALPLDFVKQFYAYRLSGNEMGLHVYLPFDDVDRKSQGIVTRFDATNQSEYNKESYKKLMILNVDEKEDVDNINSAPVLNSMKLSNLKFSWSSDGTNLLINLGMKDSEINHRNIFLTVRDVEDLNGNTMENPHSWVIYADRNVLRWDNDVEKFNVKFGEKYENTVTWRNSTSRRTFYAIETSSSFIKVNSTEGMADPERTNHLTFSIEKGITPGDYTEYIWLIDEDNDMVSTLTLNFTVEAEAPEWIVNRSRYDQNMIIVGNVYKTIGDGITIPDNDTRDIVGVFSGSECVGVANISDNNDLAHVYLTVYGDSKTANQPLTFYLWDFSEGSITKLNPGIEDLAFQADAQVGVGDEGPLFLVSSEGMMQEIALKEGWNWVALNVHPNDTTSANTVFLDNTVFSNGDVIKDASSHCEFVKEKNLWKLDKIAFSHKKVYHIFAQQPTRVHIVGTSLTDPLRTFRIKQGWNELPYTMTFNLPIENAMSDFTLTDGKASVGDVIKSIDSFAVLTAAYGWIGSLETLEPGTGYYLYHTGEAVDVTFSEKSRTDGENIHENNAKERRYVRAAEKNMVIIAAIAEDENIPEGAVVEAYSGEEFIGEATPLALPDGTRRYFVTVPQTNESVRFVMNDSEGNPLTVGALPYNGTTCIGTIERPYLFSTKVLNSESEDLYDLSGRKVKDANSSSHGNIYIKKGAKVLK